MLLLTLLAALHASQRLQLAWRVERMAATFLLAQTVLSLTVCFAGATGTFTMLGTSVWWALFLVMAFVVGGITRTNVNETLDFLTSSIAVGLERALELARRNPLTFVTLLMTATTMIYVSVQVVLAPIVPYWDPLWYHEPQVGITLQNRGFAAIELPPEPGAQKANGYPRLVEAQAALFVLHGGRALEDLPNVLALPLLGLATYVLARRWAKERTVPYALVATVLCMPTTLQHIPSLCNDVPAAAFLVILFSQALRPRITTSSLALSSLAAALALFTKWTVYFVAPFAVMIVCARVLASARRQSKLRTVAWLTLGGVLPGLLALLWPLRNLLAFNNPLWPDLNLALPSLGIHWKGNAQFGALLAAAAQEARQDQLQMNVPWKVLIDDAMRMPWTWTRWHYHEISDYGVAALFVIATLVPCAALLLIARAARRPRSLSAIERSALWALMLALIWTLLTPARWASRYHIALVVLCGALVGHALSLWSRRRAGELAGALLLGTWLSLLWSHRTLVWPRELIALAKLDPAARQRVGPDFFDASATFGSTPMTFGSVTVAALAKRRDHEHPTIATNGDSGVYLGTFWDDRYANRVVYVPVSERYAERLDEAGATWAFCRNGTPCAKFFASNPEWTALGQWYLHDPNGIMYARR